jgi:hypothetical protein
MDETPRFFDDVDLDDPDAVQAASEAADAWAAETADQHLLEMASKKGIADTVATREFAGIAIPDGVTVTDG